MRNNPKSCQDKGANVGYTHIAKESATHTQKQHRGLSETIHRIMSSRPKMCAV